MTSAVDRSKTFLVEFANSNRAFIFVCESFNEAFNILDFLCGLLYDGLFLASNGRMTDD
jgi:hypothetical protein